MKTYSAKPGEVKQEWFVIDGTDKVLGRVASEVARRLRGKHKPEFTPHIDTGDFIVVVNAGKLRVTGTKGLNKKYFRHSGYPGGIYETNFDKMQLVEVGPRFVLNPVKMFSGSFKGQVLYENPNYVSPNTVRADERRGKSSRYVQKVKAKKRRKIHEEKNAKAPDEFADLWQEHDLSD